VWRVILLFAAVLVIGNATGLIPESDDVTCTNEDGGKQCPPTCPTCTCAWHTLKTAPAPQILLKKLQFVARAVELPAPTEVHGQLAPPPMTRPPIV